MTRDQAMHAVLDQIQPKTDTDKPHHHHALAPDVPAGPPHPNVAGCQKEYQIHSEGLTSQPCSSS